MGSCLAVFNASSSLWRPPLFRPGLFFFKGEKKKSSDASTILKSQGMTDPKLSTPSTGHFTRPAPAEAPLLPSARWLAWPVRSAGAPLATAWPAPVVSARGCVAPTPPAHLPVLPDPSFTQWVQRGGMGALVWRSYCRCADTTDKLLQMLTTFDQHDQCPCKEGRESSAVWPYLYRRAFRKLTWRTKLSVRVLSWNQHREPLLYRVILYQWQTCVKSRTIQLYEFHRFPSHVWLKTPMFMEGTESYTKKIGQQTSYRV